MTSLYKRDKNGKIRIWSIVYNDNSYWTISGIYPDGKMQTTVPTFVVQKNVGKANETSLQEQVEKEVASKIQFQLDHGFTYEIPSEEKQFEVSLADKYSDRQEKGKLNFPYICEDKLDGIRAYIQQIDNKIVIKSRGHKEFVSVPHIKEAMFIKEFFAEYPNAILDGELYNHELKHDFNKIVSLVKKTKPKEKDLEESANLVQYHCFDSYYPDEPFLTYKERKNRVTAIMNSIPYSYEDCVVLVGNDCKITDEVVFNEVNNEEEVEMQLINSLLCGYEGIMLKKDVPYFFGRSFDMLKYKKFHDTEYLIVDFEEGKGNLSGVAAAVICATESGEKFKAGVTGNQDYARNLFKNRLNYVNKLATIKYQELTPIKDGKGGVPRFGKMTSIRDYE